MEIKTKTLNETKHLAKIFASALDKKGLFVTLTGDIGAGKTQFIRYVLEFLNVKDKITSPSFVILNEYKCSLFPIYHFDLYRLEQNGIKSVVSELREYSQEGVLTFIEWAEFAYDEIPSGALKINVKYDEENIDWRIYDFSAQTEETKNFMQNFTKGLKQ